MKKLYETVVIVDAMIPDEAIESEFDAISDKIKEHGELHKVVRWGRKKLAYNIKGRSHGDYGIFYYDSEGQLPQELQSGFRINENILRWLTIADFPGGVPDDRAAETSEENEASTETSVKETLV